jgi:hypothetical protein
LLNFKKIKYMKNIKNKILMLAVLGGLIINLMWSCKKDFLDVAPTGVLTESLLSSKKGLDGLLIGVYSILSGRGEWYGGADNWVNGSICGGEANKGSNNGDQALVQPVQRFETDPTSAVVSIKWKTCFEGIARANTLLRILNASTDPSVTAADKKQISAEGRFLRAHYYFELRRLYGSVPWVDETMTADQAVKVANTADIWPNIEADFKYAVDNLSETNAAVGRANSWAAKCYLAKVHLYQHHYTEAKALYDDVIAHGKTTGGLTYALVPKYADVFNAANDNNPEAVFSVQASVNTGSTNNANNDFVLNWPYNTGTKGPGGCCGFYQPSIELGNCFRTDANGLPLLDGSYDAPANALATDQGKLSTDAFTPDAGNLDPRLDHSIGRRGIPYLDWQDHPGYDWIRDQGFSGPYSPKKFVYYKSQEGTLTDVSSWTRGYTAMNYDIIRFADVLLQAAECEVEIGTNLDQARTYVNMVRTRAANPAGFVQKGGAPAAKYVIGLYNTAWTSVPTARAAVHFERKLELSGEGHRFFDLVRWGVADTEINAYLAYEGAILKNQLGGAHFTKGKNEIYPIPQDQIDLEGVGVLHQNPGY